MPNSNAIAITNVPVNKNDIMLFWVDNPVNSRLDHVCLNVNMLLKKTSEMLKKKIEILYDDSNKTIAPKILINNLDGGYGMINEL